MSDIPNFNWLGTHNTFSVSELVEKAREVAIEDRAYGLFKLQMKMMLHYQIEK